MDLLQELLVLQMAQAMAGAQQTGQINLAELGPTRELAEERAEEENYVTQKAQRTRNSYVITTLDIRFYEDNLVLEVITDSRSSNDDYVIAVQLRDRNQVSEEELDVIMATLKYFRRANLIVSPGSKIVGRCQCETIH